MKATEKKTERKELSFAEKLAAYAARAKEFDSERIPAGLTEAKNLPKFPLYWRL